MNKQRFIAIAFATGLLASAGVASAAAADEVGGGQWDRGVNWSTVWSHYFHPSRCHGSTAVGQITVKSGPTKAGQWSRASTKAGWYGNQTYWNYC